MKDSIRHLQAILEENQRHLYKLKSRYADYQAEYATWSNEKTNATLILERMATEIAAKKRWISENTEHLHRIESDVYQDQIAQYTVPFMMST